MNTLISSSIKTVADLKPGYMLGAADVALLQEMARRLLAAEAQEPMAWLWTKNDGERDVTLTNPSDDEDAHDAILAGWSYRPLYAAPQPFAVPDDFVLLLPDEIERHALTAGECPPQSKVMLVSSINRLNACRAAMLKPTQLISEIVPMLSLSRVEQSVGVPEVEICDMCGHDAWHQGGRTYECAEGHRFEVRVPKTEPVSQPYKLPDGWKLVPVEPTAEMLASAKEWTGLTRTAEVLWGKMLAAAPQPQNAQQNIPGNIPAGWTGNGDADAALVMLDRIDTVDADDDERIECVKRTIRVLAAPQEPTK